MTTIVTIKIKELEKLFNIKTIIGNGINVELDFKDSYILTIEHDTDFSDLLLFDITRLLNINDYNIHKQ